MSSLETVLNEREQVISSFTSATLDNNGVDSIGKLHGSQVIVDKQATLFLGERIVTSGVESFRS